MMQEQMIDENEEDELILGDAENYRGDKEQGFSHQKDVAIAIARVLQAGSTEMIPGYTDFKKDKATGEMIMSKYHPDTREIYIECVNNYYDIVIAEVIKGGTYTEKIEKILKKKKDCYQKWAVEEHKFWKTLDFKKRTDILHVVGSISKESHFYSQFMLELVNISRELARTLHLLLDDIKYWKTVDAVN